MMSRALLKSGLGVALASTATDRLIGAITGVRRLPLVVGYHRVVESLTAERAAATPAMTISVRTFIAQLDWIGRRYRFVSLDEIGARLAAGAEWAEPVAAVTFDDGYRDMYERALPVLTRKGIPAAVFIATDTIGAPALFTHDRLYLLLARDWPNTRALLERQLALDAGEIAARSPFDAMRFFLTTRAQDEIARLIAVLEQHGGPLDAAPKSLQPLTWDMVSTLQRAGIIIGSHTRTHPVLTNEDPAHVADELKSSRDAIQQRLGCTVRHFAYPDGAFDAAVVAAVAAAGYQTAFTCCQHRYAAHAPLTISRRVLWENSSLDARGRFSPSVMGCLANGVYDFAVRHQHGHRHRPALADAIDRRAPIAAAPR